MIILPSSDYSCDRTVDLVKALLRRGRLKQKLIGVVQGINLEALQECYNFLSNYCDIIGLPSPLEIIARREEIARDLVIKERLLYIEVYSNPFEEVPPKGSLGICTSYPVRLAVDMRKLHEYIPTPSSLDFNLPKGSIVGDLLKRNIEEYMEVIGYSNITSKKEVNNGET